MKKTKDDYIQEIAEMEVYAGKMCLTKFNLIVEEYCLKIEHKKPMYLVEFVDRMKLDMVKELHGKLSQVCGLTY